MECFCDEYITSCGKKAYLCAFCQDGESQKVKDVYKAAVEKADFENIKDDYFIDVKLYKIISQITPESVPAMGIGIIIKDSIHIGGGIIGNPFCNSESAEDDMDYIENNFWCIAFGGRYGAVFCCEDKKEAEKHSENIKKFNRQDIKNAIYSTRDYLKNNVSEFLILSDGSGLGAYPYCACYMDGKIEELDFGINN